MNGWGWAVAGFLAWVAVVAVIVVLASMAKERRLDGTRITPPGRLNE